VPLVSAENVSLKHDCLVLALVICVIALLRMMERSLSIYEEICHLRFIEGISAASTCTSHSRPTMAVALRGGAKTTATRGRASWWMQGGGAARDIATTSSGEREANGRWSRRHDIRWRPSKGGSMDKRMGGRGALVKM